MLKDRLRTSAVLIAITCCLLYLDARHSIVGAEGLWLLPLLLFFAFGTASEIASLLQGSGRPIWRPAAMAASGLVTLSACIPLLWPLVGSTYPEDCPVGRLGWISISSVAAVFGILISEMVSYGKGPSGAIERTCGASFVSLYVGLPITCSPQVRLKI